MNRLIAVLSVTVLFGVVHAANLTDFEVMSLSGDRTQIVLSFDAPVSEPVGYSIEEPARISLDFDGVSSLLAEKYIQIGSGNTRNAAILDAGDRTRIVFSLATLVNYAVQMDGNVVSVYLGDGVEDIASSGRAASNSAQAQPVASAQSSSTPVSGAKEISDVDFRRTESGAGQVVVGFDRPNASASVYEEGGDIVIQVDDYNVPSELRRKLDVIDFATAVHYISVYNEDEHALIRLDVDGAYDYLAYQSDRQMIVEVNQLTEDEAEARIKEKFPYTGEKLSLNFQDIEVRDVLQIIANYIGFNLVASDSISGTITLRLNNVPWDQALELVLKTNGLDKRQTGNVLLVAPAAELAEQERLELEAREQAEKLAPLRTEYVQVNYARAADIASILRSSSSAAAAAANVGDESGGVNSLPSSGGFLSSRGSVSVDERTNTLIITDTSVNLDGIRSAISFFDVPVEQVLIEARIVSARTSVGDQLGVRWGGAIFPSQNVFATGTVESSASIESDIYGGSPNPDLTFPDAFAVNLPATGNASSFAVGLIADNLLDLDLEISALESLGEAEVVSQPKIVTSDGQAASIFSGQNVAFPAEDGGTQFIEAGLNLNVTPQVTPDDKVILTLTVNQDSLAAGGGAIDTNTVSTQVLVENGVTLVLGGVYRTEKTQLVEKAPILGDLPVVGNLFKRTTTSDERSELLIFITPKLIQNGLISN
ncbi:type IV pilus secretin PilQ [Reinekea blandensis]|uniref:Type 4 fimbrial biogenesis protein PilQ n=1 Tax=Reinekea blandensis MED297 TaxID=314283 RepID=A4BAN5_9GAMM|nr:type IV pilus secretin PilQ [Reinekea blandensis]EAR10991.1 type 4 fimbrial biogenesis protein PilQ [Reinekea sp. MED297] [Reinekea blandensis MED297]